jgi:hypothetical protein
MVADPDWEAVSKQLAEFSKQEVGQGVSQIAYAKELATLELSQTANSLARAKGSSESVISAFSRDAEEGLSGLRVTSEVVSTRREYSWPEPTLISDDVTIVGARFEGTLPGSEIEMLRTVASPSEHGERKREESRGTNWEVYVDELTAELRSPLGSTFRLTLLEE